MTLITATDKTRKQCHLLTQSKPSTPAVQLVSSAVLISSLFSLLNDKKKKQTQRTQLICCDMSVREANHFLGESNSSGLTEFPLNKDKGTTANSTALQEVWATGLLGALPHDLLNRHRWSTYFLQLVALRLSQRQWKRNRSLVGVLTAAELPPRQQLPPRPQRSSASNNYSSSQHTT